MPEAACARRRASAEARQPAIVPAVRALRHVGAQHRIHTLGEQVRIGRQNAMVQRVVPVVASAAEVEDVLPPAPPDGGDELVVVEGVVQEMHPLAGVVAAPAPEERRQLRLQLPPRRQIVPTDLRQQRGRVDGRDDDGTVPPQALELLRQLRRRLHPGPRRSRRRGGWVGEKSGGRAARAGAKCRCDYAQAPAARRRPGSCCGPSGTGDSSVAATGHHGPGGSRQQSGER